MLKPGADNKYTVVAQSGTFHLIPFLGTVLDEPLSLPPTFTTFTAIPVKPGDVIGLTVPTWAPVLSYNLDREQVHLPPEPRHQLLQHSGHPDGPDDGGRERRLLRAATPAPGSSTRATEVVNQPYPKTYVGGPTTTKKNGGPALDRPAVSRRRGSAGRTPS